MGYEADGFLAAIAAAPAEDGPRLIYADWLDEHGDPRGDLIRVQIALSKLPPFDPRRHDLVRSEEQLLARYGDLWASPFRGLATGPVFKRGFVEEVKVTARQFLAHPDELFNAGPVRHVHLLDAASHIATVLASPPMARLVGLTVYAQYLRVALAEAIWASPHLTGLHTLHVGRNHMGDPGVRRLIYAALGAVNDLDLSENELTDDAVRDFERAHRLPALARLELAGNAITASAAERLANPALFPHLERLGLAANRLGGCGPLGPTLARPAMLDLANNALTATNIAGLLAEPVAGVRELDLSHNRLEDEGVRALAEAPSAAGLRVLRLTGNNITDAGLAILARSPQLARLTSLDLGNNPISDDGFQILLESRTLRRVTRLVFPGAGLTLRTRLALERRFNRALT